MNDKSKKIVQQLLSALLFLAVVVMLAVLSSRYKAQLDWTAGHRNTLTEASRKTLENLHDPLTVYAFVAPSEATRQDIASWIGRYQRFKKDITINWIDPATQPQKVKDFQIEVPGEVVLEYQGRREDVTTLGEREITGALQRLASADGRYIVFLEGDGERSIDGQDRTDLGKFAQFLRDKGLKVESVNLIKTPAIPQNASMLVLASPSHALLEGEQQLLADYVKKGGNLLWLDDPDDDNIADALASELGITWQKGFAVFPDYQLLNTGSPAIYLATSYPPKSPVTAQMVDATAFPLVRSLAFSAADKSWDWQPMLSTEASAWLETGKSEGEVSFDPKSGDIAGPLTIGATMSRPVPDAAASADAARPDTGKPAAAQQRIALVGDADFLSDANIDVLGNRQLAMNIVQWLADRDGQMNLDIPKAPDIGLYLSGPAMWLIVCGFVIVLPIGLLAWGVSRWAIRRRS